MLYWTNKSKFGNQIQRTHATCANLDVEKSAIAAHSLSLGHRFEEKPILLKHINNRPLPELLILEKIFIYKYKEVSINFETPQFSDLYKLMDADCGRQKALVTGQSNSRKHLDILVKTLEFSRKNIIITITSKIYGLISAGRAQVHLEFSSPSFIANN